MYISSGALPTSCAAENPVRFTLWEGFHRHICQEQPHTHLQISLWGIGKGGTNGDAS
jgi:hypothetical protein